MISKIVLHRDGISLPDYFSLRLSNIPNNLYSTLQILTAFKGKLFLGIISRLFQEASSKQCHDFDPEGAASDVFLTHNETKSNLWVHHTMGTSFSEALNNTCGFFLSNKKNLSYFLENCECPFIGKESGPDYTVGYDSVYIYGNNSSDQLIDCISTFISDNFCPIKKKELIYFGIAMAALFACIVCGVSCYACWDKILELRDRAMGLFQPLPLHAIPLHVQGDSVAEETHFSYGTNSNSNNVDFEVVETPSPQ